MQILELPKLIYKFNLTYIKNDIKKICIKIIIKFKNKFVITITYNIYVVNQNNMEK